MTYKVCRKRSTSTFKINDQYCKIFFTPLKPWNGEYWMWDIGFAVSKSKHQLNDWYTKKKNKRAKKLTTQLTGKAGIKTLTEGLRTVLRMRWTLEPGDCLFLGCESCEPEKQFRAYCRWLKDHPDWRVDVENKRFWWHRPPFADDPLYELGRIIPTVPADPLAPVVELNYFQSFLFDPFPEVLEDMLQSMAQIHCQSDQAQ